MRKLTKNLVLFCVMVITIGLLLSSCSRVGLLNFISDRDGKAVRETSDAVIKALEEKDKDGLKSLFSVAAISEIPDLDEKIDAFFGDFNNPIEIEKAASSGYSGEHIEYGKRQTRLHSSYIIVAGEIRYHVGMVIYSKDDFDKDNEGIHILEFSTDEAINSKYYASHLGYDAGPGFYFQDSAEKRDDIRWIEDRPWDYTPYDRVLTADDIRKVVEKDDDYNNLVATIGNPNCSWKEYSYYYFELENGLFAVVKVDNDLRPRDYFSNGKIVELNLFRPNAIVAVYIADEESNLETIWMADDIVKVLGSYHYCLHIDRELSEDFFKTFAERSQSLNQLKSEIGASNIDEPMYWRCYYKISADCYVECHISGDNIEEISVVDTEDRLYTIWKAEPSTE